MSKPRFLFLFLNTAVLSVYLNTRFESNLLKRDSVNYGEEWYLDAGSAILMTMSLNVVAPHCAPLTKAFVCNPAKRFINPYFVSAMAQFELNKQVRLGGFKIQFKKSDLIFLLRCAQLLHSLSLQFSNWKTELQPFSTQWP